MEWYVEVRLHYPGPKDPRSDEYADLADEFYGAVSEYLGGEAFTSPMGLATGGLETCVYVDAGDPGEAGETVERMLSEISEKVWGAGTTVEIARVITAEERDRELRKVRRIATSTYEVPDDPEEVDENLARELDLENRRAVLDDYRELEERSVTGEELERRFDVSRDRLDRMRGAGELVGVWVPYKLSYRYPDWQFDPASRELLPGLAELSRTAAEAGMDEMSFDGFMTSPEAGEGTPPEAVYRSGPEGRRTVLSWLAAARSGGS